jgi:hypothetical protein
MRLFLLFFLAANFSYGQVSNLKELAVFKPVLKKDSVANDLKILYGLLNTVHPAQFAFCTKTEFDRTYDSLSKSIKSDLSFSEFYCKTSLLIAKIKDGHAWIDNMPIRNELKSKLVFPFSIYKTNNSICISQSAIKAGNDLVGKTILKINHQPIQDIALQITQLRSVEGRNEAALNAFPLFPFYYYLSDTSSVFEIEYLDSSGIKASTFIKGIEYNAYIKNTRKIVPVVEQDFKENGIAILKVNTFDQGDFEYEKINYRDYFDEFFRKVHTLKINKLIIDVRGNGGGSAEISNYLFSCLTDKSYYYFESICKRYRTTGEWKRYSTMPQYINELDSLKTPRSGDLYCETATGKKSDPWWFKEQKGKKNCYKGNIITLVDGNCFSTTGHFIALLKYYSIGELYGECSQANYTCNSTGYEFQLPYSKSLVKIPLGRFSMRMPGFKYDPKGICPDVYIPKEEQDFKTGYDRQLNTALKQLNK